MVRHSVFQCVCIGCMYDSILNPYAEGTQLKIYHDKWEDRTSTLQIQGPEIRIDMLENNRDVSL